QLRTPYVSILIFCGIACLVLIPGKTDFLANMYAYGAMLSFTLAHAAIFTLRIRDPATPRPYRGRPNITVGGRDVPLFAVLGGLGTGLAFIAVLVLHDDARFIGTAWMVVGLGIYVLYRRHQGLSLVESSALARPTRGAEVEIAYTNILVPVVADEVSEDIMATAGKLAADQGTVIEAMTVIEVPINLPLSAQLPRAEAAADELLQRAKTIAEEYGARVVTQVLRARQAGRAIVDEATRIEAEVILM